jgi:hypothetical protein
MDAVRKYLNNPLVVGVIGLFAGLLVGLVVLGWWLFPVEWVDATPAELSAYWQEEFLRMTISDYGVNGNAELALERYNALGEGKEESMAAVVQNPQGLNPNVLQSFSTIALGGAMPAAAPTFAAPTTPLPGTPGLPAAPTGTPVVGTPAVEGGSEKEGGSSSILSILLVVLCGLFLLLIAVGAAFLYMRNKDGVSRFLGSRSQPAATPRPAPVAHYTANYKLGMDMFDESFSVETPAGEFLGEGGVGISEAIGVGAPKKVTAFEAWLFDKDDVLTVTKVLMSPHAFADEATRERLSARGEPIEVASGGETILETKNLYAVARILEINYGDGALPPESYFDRLVLDMVVWVKS